ncbi:hypothetical protein [uncultured Dokdonia sp.]|uniref:hypothetical protein n=1 Tax=uncultured Dokdonia sp. TaxID=575653 RepID=UPI00344F1A20
MIAETIQVNVINPTKRNRCASITRHNFASITMIKRSRLYTIGLIKPEYLPFL